MKFRSRFETAPRISEHRVMGMGLGFCFRSLERKWSATWFSSGTIPKFCLDSWPWLGPISGNNCERKRKEGRKDKIMAWIPVAPGKNTFDLYYIQTSNWCLALGFAFKILSLAEWSPKRKQTLEKVWDSGETVIYWQFHNRPCTSNEISFVKFSATWWQAKLILPAF